MHSKPSRRFGYQQPANSSIRQCFVETVSTPKGRKVTVSCTLKSISRKPRCCSKTARRCSYYCDANRRLKVRRSVIHRATILPMTMLVYLHSKFPIGLQKMHNLRNSVRTGRSRSFEDRWLEYRSKARVLTCNFLWSTTAMLLLFCSVLGILQTFLLWTATSPLGLFRPKFGDVPLWQLQ